jgi:hypothetical protein
MICPAPELLAAWTDADVTREQHQRLCQHVLECGRCAVQAKQLRALTHDLRSLELAPAAPRFSAEFEARLTATQSVRGRARGPLLAAMASAAAVLALGLFFVVPGRFSERGGATRGSRVGFEVYLHEPGREPARLHDGHSAGTSAGYSFLVFNRSRQQQRLLLFALDAQAEVHWFYPAFLDPTSNPRSILIPAAPQVRALPEGITPEAPAPGAFRIVGVFSRAALTVHEVESVLRAGGLEALVRARPDAQIHVLRAELRAEGPPP